MNVATNIGVCSEQAVVGIEACSLGVIVARAQMHVISQPLVFASDDQTHLGVGLVAHHAVHHVCAHSLQTLCQINVVCLVKTSPQFNNNGDFLSVLGRFYQSVNDG